MADRTFVGTRCCAPALPDQVVRRSRLEELLDGGQRRQVTLVAGPPGSGKTTLLASASGGPSGGRFAWLTVDRRDDEAGRLAELVVEALRRAGALPGLPHAGVGEEALLDAAFEHLADRGGPPWRLIMDDAHELISPGALRVLGHLVAKAPPGLHVIVAARADPPVAWRRLALEGSLQEIRADQLAFTESEVAELAAAAGVRLSPRQLRVLWQRTEGWAAGLSLAVSALATGDDVGALLDQPALTDAAVEYLLAEVLDRQEPAVQDFLRRASVAEWLTPGLAAALTGRPDAGRVLDEVFRLGLFLGALDGTPCYRYHAPFRTLLHRQLQESDPGLADQLHRTAAAWFLAHAAPDEAEAHARAAADWSLVGRLILERWLRGMGEEAEHLPRDPLAGVPAEAILVTPELAMVAVSEACRWGDQEKADLYRGRLPAAPPPTPGSDGSLWARARLVGDLTYSWCFGADERSRAAAAWLRAPVDGDASMVQLRHLAVLGQVEQDIEAGALGQARADLEQLAHQGSPSWPRTLATASLAVVDGCAGALWAAEEHVAQVLADLEGRATAPTVFYVQIASAIVAAQRGTGEGLAAGQPVDPAQMEWSPWSLRCVDRAVRAATSGGAPFFVCLDEATALHPLAERALLALGVLEVVDHRGRSIVLGGDGDRVVLDARRHLVEGAPERSEDALAGWLDHVADRHPRTAVEASALAALAADERGDAERAGRRLRSAFDLALATGILAPLLDLGHHLRTPVERHLDGLGPAAAAALELLDRFRRPGTGRLVEPLTDREVEILRRLPTLMSNAEIGDALHLSVNTVKTHLKALYRKLGVHTRRQALQRGRELELV